ncbi:hypothetical protein SDC9_177051 [bioreactor metagenome]|uniref:Uncharacterized protein n=1 Tax=bioreactor metagenome TaxID=1076179 RepID=A0A645GRV8_9ZZZZ
MRIIEILAVTRQQPDQRRHLAGNRNEILVKRKSANAATAFQISLRGQRFQHTRDSRTPHAEHRRQLVRTRNLHLLIRVPVDEIHDIVPDFHTFTQLFFDFPFYHDFSG